MKKMPIAVLVSGSGTNLQAIIDQTDQGLLPVEIKVVISNNPKAYGLKRAQKAGIETEVLNLKDFLSLGKKREDFEAVLSKIVLSYEVELVVLAGWMLILGETFLDHFPLKVINLHPALLPSFKGTHAIERAYQYGVKYTGVSVHFVDKGVDTGPIILQQPLKVDYNEGIEYLEEKVHELEHKLLPQAIKYFAEGKIILKDRIVKITN